MDVLLIKPFDGSFKCVFFFVLISLYCNLLHIACHMHIILQLKQVTVSYGNRVRHHILDWYKKMAKFYLLMLYAAVYKITLFCACVFLA